MIITILCGGLGTRFAIYTNIPKPLIIFKNKPIICWVIDSLNTNEIYIPYNKILIEFNFEKILQAFYPNKIFHFYPIDIQTRGAVESLVFLLNKLNLPDCPLLSLDNDTYYPNIDLIKLWNNENIVFTFTFESEITSHSPYSHVVINNNNNISEIREKEYISPYASCGAYGFSSYKILLKWCKYIIDNDIRFKNEYYISTVINEMIKHNIIFKNINIDGHICLGTPEDIIILKDM